MLLFAYMLYCLAGAASSGYLEAWAVIGIYGGHAF